MDSRLLKEFRDIFNNHNIQSSIDYYKVLCLWVNRNKKIFGEHLLHINRLNVLTSLDIEKYIINSSEIDLNNEINRIRKIDFKSLDGLLMFISDTMWEMITIASSKECYNCKYGDVRYIKINYKDCKGKVVLECQDCGQIMNINGIKITEKIQNYLPATKKEVEDAIYLDNNIF